MLSAPSSLVPRTIAASRVRRALTPLATILLFAALPSTAVASELSAVGPASTPARIRVAASLEPTTTLPARSATAQRLAPGSPAGWLIGATGDHDRLARLATEAGGTYDATLRLLSIPASSADALARRLGPAVTWAGPDVPATRTSSLDGRNNVQSPWSRSVGLPPSLTPTPGTLAAIGIIDDPVDHHVAELASAKVINDVAPLDPHGTMVASTAAAPFNGIGVVGVAPGAPLISWGTSSLTCGDVARGITNVVRRGARVVNLSLDFDQSCFAVWQAVSYAYARNVPVVAASGNEGDKTNLLLFPAAYPHVITVAAVDQSLNVADFSNYNDYVDIAAPGVGVPVDIPRRFDVLDRRRDGVTVVDGTSFSAPYVSGAVSWILGARPGLDPSQVAGLLRSSALDLGAPAWDVFTGYGLVQIAPAMAGVAPPVDALEPNDLPAFVQSRGTFRQRLVWSGKAPAAITATGDSADDNIDAYRVRVPAHARMRAVLTPSAGLANLFAFDQGVSTFTGRPLDASTEGGTTPDTITLRNRSARPRSALIVVNTVPDDDLRLQSTYTLSIDRG